MNPASAKVAEAALTEHTEKQKTPKVRKNVSVNLEPQFEASMMDKNARPPPHLSTIQCMATE